MSVDALPLAVFAASQIGTPGPANMTLMATGARYGLTGALPFVAGVLLGKQLVIWPLGLGLAEIAVSAPLVFGAMKWASAGYICYLAWRIAGMRMTPGALGTAPGFAAGLIVHPLNPKAWAMIVASFTGFVAAGSPVVTTTLTVAAILFCCQLVFHPVWTLAGQRIASLVAGTAYETYLMRVLAILTVASVAFVLIGGPER